MEIRIQFETKNDLSGYEGIARVNNLSCGVGSADSFKWECDLEWTRSVLPCRGQAVYEPRLHAYSFIGQSGEDLNRKFRAGMLSALPHPKKKPHLSFEKWGLYELPDHTTSWLPGMGEG